MNIADYQPFYYENVQEFKLIAEIEDGLLSQLKQEIEIAHKNNFVVTANEKAVGIYESALGIIANPQTETLAFRRQRILNRYQMRLPYNLAFLKEKLNKIMGAGKYVLTVDYEHYTMYLETAVENSHWFKEATITINWIKPANIRFIVIPVIFDTITLKEQAYVSKIIRFKAGVNKAGDKLLTITDQKEVALK